jgi:hypothetical protein
MKLAVIALVRLPVHSDRASIDHARPYPPQEDHLRRYTGVRGILIDCADYQCSHSFAISTPSHDQKRDRPVGTRSLDRRPGR